MAVVKWTFNDPTMSETYVFEVNPKQGGTPAYEKNLSYVNTAGPDGRVLAFEGRSKPQEGQFSGTILSEEQYNAMLYWFNKRNQIYMSDDLGRAFTIYITKLDAKRIRAVSHPWKHDYTVNYVILDWIP